MTTLAIHLTNDSAFEAFMQQYRPEHCAHHLIQYDGGIRHMVFYVHEFLKAPPNVNWSYQDHIAYPIGARSTTCIPKFSHNHSYAPCYGIQVGWKAISKSFRMMAEHVWQGQFTHLMHQDNVKKPEQHYTVNKSTFQTIHLKCWQRLTILALAIALLVRGLLEALSLGCLNWIFYPLDAIFDRCMQCQKSIIPTSIKNE